MRNVCMVDSRDRSYRNSEQADTKREIIDYVTQQQPRKVTALEVSGAIDVSLQESRMLLEQLARSAEIQARPSTGRYANRYCVGSQ